MLGRYEIGDTVGYEADREDLRALLHRYDAAQPPVEQGKIGVGISHFSKQWTGGEGYATPCFYVHRSDGSMDDLSYRRAINEG
jgi:hypothetical protein